LLKAAFKEKNMKEIFNKIKVFFVQLPSKIKHLNIRKFNWTTVLAILSYFHILVLIPLIFSKNHPFIRFHAKQGLVVLAFFALGVFSMFLPVLPWIFAGFFIFFFVFGIITVILGRERPIPLIGRVARVI
jgi:fumarate reductase subunit D